MEIYLPTRGRVNNQVTLNLLPDCILQYVNIVCYPGEEESLHNLYGNKVFSIKGIEHAHIGMLRQICIDNATQDIVVFVDDSLDFHTRAPQEHGEGTKLPLKGILDKHFTPETKERHYREMFEWLIDIHKSNLYGMAGISRRSSNAYSLNVSFKRNDRICSFWSINRTLMRSLKGQPKFTDMMLKEDFYMCLHFLTNGIPTITNYRYAYGRVNGGANSPGGCSIYRNIERSNASAYELKKHFPNFVNLSIKGTKSWGGDFKEKAIDVQIDWKAAYEYGVNRDKIRKGLF